MTLALNGTEVLGHEMIVSATLPLAGEDISGNSSAAAQAETGDKSKNLSVNMLIRYVNHSWLTSLINLAEAKNDTGERATYTIINHTAKAMNIRQVRFLGDVSVREDGSLDVWRVSFRLTEVKSVPEVKETRQTDQPVTDIPAAGDQTVQATPEVDQSQPLTGFEKIIARVDKWIGDATQ